jgi:uncharacterized protein (TIGR02996 family)
VSRIVGSPAVRDGGERNAELEAAIASAPGDPAGYLVYADWLQHRGEPRGELVVVQHALMVAPMDQALWARQAALFADHRERLLGPIAELERARIDWYMGFVRGIELASTPVLGALLAHPSLAFVRRLTVALGEDGDIAPLAEAPRTLRWLELDGDTEPLRELARCLRRMPTRLLGIEHLRIRTRTYRSIAEWLAD